jgi:3-oxoacyl-[acyl-carrier protein] reductase
MPETLIALITGGTRGIGLAIAERLAREGKIVAVNYCANEQAASAALDRLRALCPSAVAIRADVSIPEEAERLIEQVVSHFGRLDILVNNVGPFLIRPPLETSNEEWRHILDTNLSSAFYCTKFALARMRKQKSGNIVNLGSLNCELARGAPTTMAYSAAKAALVVLTKSFARTEGRHGIRVNIVNPGFVETYATSESDRQQMPPIIPLERLGRPEDIAAAVSYLVSDEASYVTGAVLNVHGGLWG